MNIIKSKLIIIIINIYFIKNIICGIPGCLEATSGCYKDCGYKFTPCEDGFSPIFKEVPGLTADCYCYRPYNSDEINQINGDKCDGFISQCFTLEYGQYSCSRVMNICNNDKKIEFCQRANDIKHNNGINVCKINKYK